MAASTLVGNALIEVLPATKGAILSMAMTFSKPTRWVEKIWASYLTGGGYRPPNDLNTPQKVVSG